MIEKVILVCVGILGQDLHLGRLKEDRCTSSGTLTPKSAPLMGP